MPKPITRSFDKKILVSAKKIPPKNWCPVNSFTSRDMVSASIKSRITELLESDLISEEAKEKIIFNFDLISKGRAGEYFLEDIGLSEDDAFLLLHELNADWWKQYDKYYGTQEYNKRYGK